MVVMGQWGGDRAGEYRVPFGGDENILNLDYGGSCMTLRTTGIHLLM